MTSLRLTICLRMSTTLRFSARSSLWWEWWGQMNSQTQTHTHTLLLSYHYLLSVENMMVENQVQLVSYRHHIKWMNNTYSMWLLCVACTRTVWQQPDKNNMKYENYTLLPPFSFLSLPPLSLRPSPKVSTQSTTLEWSMLRSSSAASLQRNSGRDATS